MSSYESEINKGYTLLLNDSWDIQLDTAGNIATTAGAYAVAQNAANAVRLFTNDAYFDAEKGIPHFSIELGKKPSVSQAALISRIKAAVLAVDGVTACEPVLEYEKDGRIIGGEITITLEGGASVAIEL